MHRTQAITTSAICLLIVEYQVCLGMYLLTVMHTCNYDLLSTNNNMMPKVITHYLSGLKHSNGLTSKPNIMDKLMTITRIRGTVTTTPYLQLNNKRLCHSDNPFFRQHEYIIIVINNLKGGNTHQHTYTR